MKFRLRYNRYRIPECVSTSTSWMIVMIIGYSVVWSTYKNESQYRARCAQEKRTSLKSVSLWRSASILDPVAAHALYTWRRQRERASRSERQHQRKKQEQLLGLWVDRRKGSDTRNPTRGIWWQTQKRRLNFMCAIILEVTSRLRLTFLIF